MTGVEICLLVAGIVFFAASFMVGNKNSNEMTVLSQELSEQDKEKIRRQIDAIVKEQIDKNIDEQIEIICERTEAQLDKISNTKTLELNEYAETVIKEINKNHNEVVFLYDMLNEKAKEVKNTVKDVNIVKDQVIRMENSAPLIVNTIDNTNGIVHNTNIKEDTNTEALMDEMLAHVMETEKTKISNENEPDNIDDTELISDDKASQDTSYEKNENKNDKILSLYERGMSNKDIAKTLGLGVGEVKLVVDLYKGFR